MAASDHMRGTKDKIIKRLKKHLKKKDAKIRNLELVTKNQLAKIKELTPPPTVWTDPPKDPTTTYKKVRFHDGIEAWECYRVYVGASSTQHYYYYLTPAGFTLDVRKYSPSWLGKVTERKEI